MVALQGDLVGFAERLDQLHGRGRLGILKGLASELLTTEEPHQAFRRLPLLLPFLILYQPLQGVR